MPSWKKVIISGSDASLNTLTVSNGITGSLQGTASYYSETDPIFVSKSGSLATTGSNIFIGNQTINGNLFMSGGFRLVYNNDPTTNLLFGQFDGSAIHGPYYQQFGNQYPNIVQRGGAEIIYDIRNNPNANFHISSFDGSSWTQKFLVDDNGVQVTGSLNVSNGITGSLFGTASYASHTLSSSYALTASYVNILKQNVVVTGSLYITGSILNTDAIQFNTASSVTLTPGGINWDDGNGTLNVLLKGGNIDLQVGQENVVLVNNGEATTLTKAEVVYVSGSQGNRPKVKRASAVSDGYSVTTLGFAAESITSGAEGYITTFGMLNNIDTSGTTGGDPVWLSPTINGGWTTTKPQAPSHTVLLGYIVRVSNTVGSIFVHISNGWELEELHNVRITSSTSSYGDLLVQSGSLWINSKQLTGSYGLTGSLSATSFTGSLFGSASYALTSSFSLNAAILSASFAIASASIASRLDSLESGSLGPGVIAVDAATTASLRASTYYNGLANDGVGATLTSVSNGALGVIDGSTSLLNWRILVKDQTTQLQNGVYELSQTGSTLAPFILTRTTDSDDSTEFSPQVVIPSNGIINKGLNFAQITENPIVGTNSIIYQQLSGSNNFITQQTVGTQAVNQIPIYTAVAKELTRGSSTFTYNVSTGQLKVRNVTYTYPAAQGANGTVLMNNGAGVLRWANNFSGSFSGSFTGSLQGTSSWSTNSITASFINPLSQQVQITGSLQVLGAVVATNFTGSLFGTASWATQAVSASFAATASSVNPLNQNVIINGAVTASYMILSGSGGNVNRLLVVGSGSNTPLFTVQGSQGELFSITDSLSGSLFSVNDISGLPILEVFSDNTTIIGSYTAPALVTTTKTVISSTGKFTVYSIPTSSYDGAFYEYVLKSSGGRARAGQISAVWVGSSVNYTETTTMDIGDTSGISLGVFLSGSNLALTGSAASVGWTLKTIVRGI